MAKANEQELLETLGVSLGTIKALLDTFEDVPVDTPGGEGLVFSVTTRDNLYKAKVMIASLIENFEAIGGDIP